MMGGPTKRAHSVRSAPIPPTPHNHAHSPSHTQRHSPPGNGALTQALLLCRVLRLALRPPTDDMRAVRIGTIVGVRADGLYDVRIDNEATTLLDPYFQDEFLHFLTDFHIHTHAAGTRLLVLHQASLRDVTVRATPTAAEGGRHALEFGGGHVCTRGCSLARARLS